MTTSWLVNMVMVCMTVSDSYPVVIVRKGNKPVVDYRYNLVYMRMVIPSKCYMIDWEISTPL